MVNKITVEGVTYTVTSEIVDIKTGKIEPYDRDKHLDILTKQYIEAMPLESIIKKDSKPKSNVKPKFVCYVDENGRTECEIIK